MSTNDHEVPEEIEKGERNDTLTSIAGKIRNTGAGEEAIRQTLTVINQKRCKPPLASDEIDSIADSVSDYEPGNSSFQKDTKDMKHQDNFLPTTVAKRLLQQEKEKGNHYAYVVDQGVYYRYQEGAGVWEEHSKKYLEKLIRDFLQNCQFGKKCGDKSFYGRETLERFQHLITDEKNDERFEPGRDPVTDRINFRNGMYDLQKGVLEQHSKRDYSLVQIPWDYDREAECEKWRNALKDWLPQEDTRKFLQEYVGYCLVPDTSQHKFLYLTGSGANGKSTFLSVLEEMFGEEITSNIPLRKLIDGGRFEKAYLRGKLVNFCADIDSKYIDSTGLLKKLVAGDTVRAEIKHGKSFDFSPFVRLIFSANELPVSKDKSKAFYRRMKIVEFPNEFEIDAPDTDPDLEEKLVNEIPGIINWAIEGLNRLRKNGSFTFSSNMQDKMKRYKRVNDSVRAFYEDRIVKEAGNKMPTEFVMKYYEDYCDRHNTNPQGSNKLVPRFKNEFNVKHGSFTFPICEKHDNYMCDENSDCRTEDKTEDMRRRGFEGIKIDKVKQP
jgi:putative DNA primase/helicase